MMLPEPVSAIATSVAGPSGLISGVGFSVALPDLPVVRLTHVTFSGSLCSAAGPGVPIAVNTYAVWAARGPGFGIGAGPATDIAVAITLPPSDRQPFPIDGYMNSCVGGASGPKAGGGVEDAGGAARGRSRIRRRWKQLVQIAWHGEVVGQLDREARGRIARGGRLLHELIDR